MLNVKGFVSFSELINNAPGVVAAVGELSTYSRTFSLDKGEYSNGQIKGYTLTTFKSSDEFGQTQALPPSLSDQIIELVSRLSAYTQTHTQPYDTADLRATLTNYFFNRITALSLSNEFVSNGGVSLPEWVQWTSTETAGSTVKIWLSDQAFRNQYDEYKIVVVPPVASLSSFFSSYATTVAEVTSLGVSGLLNKINNAKQNQPETVVRTQEFVYRNSANLNQWINVNFGIIIYGNAGDTIDNIKDAIAAHLLANSSQTQDQWERVLPDVFKRTEVILLPRWDLVAVPNLTGLASIYSGFVYADEAARFALSACVFYDLNHTAANTFVMPYLYKGITVVGVNGQTNSEGFEKISDLYSDYFPVSTSSPDFSRLKQVTQQWVLFLERLFIYAESTTQDTSTPADIRKVSRGGNLYVAQVFNNVNYLVAVKANAMYQS